MTPNPNPETTLFTGLALGPGTWYLILSAATSADTHLAWLNGDAATTGPAVTTNPTGLTRGTWADLAYAPASTWGTYPRLAYSVRGTPVPATPVPEPATALLTTSGLLWAIRRYRVSRASGQRLTNTATFEKTWSEEPTGAARWPMEASAFHAAH